MIERVMRAALIKEVQSAREHLDMVLALLIPDAGDGEDECPHPVDKIENLSTMGDPLYRCTLCGVEQPEMFHSSL